MVDSNVFVMLLESGRYILVEMQTRWKCSFSQNSARRKSRCNSRGMIEFLCEGGQRSIYSGIIGMHKVPKAESTHNGFILIDLEASKELVTHKQKDPQRNHTMY